MGEPTSVIGLAIAFGLSFLSALQYTQYVVKNNDKERKVLIKELDTVKVFNLELEKKYNAIVLEHRDLSLKYNRLASAAKRIKDDNDLLRNLTTPEMNKTLSDTEITNIEAEVSLDVQVQLDIDTAEK